MWMLILIFTGHMVVLERYTTKAECHNEGERILVEMEKAYPDDSSIELWCKQEPTSKV